MKNVNIYTASGIKSPRQKAGYIAYVLEYKVEMLENPATLSNIKEISASANQSELIVLIEALKHLKMPCHLVIYTFSTQLVSAFRNGWIVQWEQTGWKTAKNKPVANAELWQELLNLLNAHEYEWRLNEKHSYRQWMQRELDKRKGECT